jgi:hypothetical protein
VKWQNGQEKAERPSEEPETVHKNSLDGDSIFKAEQGEA